MDIFILEIYLKNSWKVKEHLNGIASYEHSNWLKLSEIDDEGR